MSEVWEDVRKAVRDPRSIEPTDQAKRLLLGVRGWTRVGVEPELWAHPTWGTMGLYDAWRLSD